MATLAQWDSGPLPSTHGATITTDTGPGFPATFFTVNHDGTDATYARWEIPSATTVAVRFYWRAPDEWPTSTHAIGTLRPTQHNIASRVSISGDSLPGVLRLYRTAGAQVWQSAGSAGPIIAGEWHRIEWQINQTTEQCRAAIFPLDSDTPLAESGWQAGALQSSTTLLDLGATAGATPEMGEMAFAHVAVTDDVSAWIGRHPSDTGEPLETGDFEVVERVGGVTSVLDVVERAGGATTVLELIEGAGGPPPTAAPLVGIYDGPISAATDIVDRVESRFGVTPRFISNYTQQNETNYELGTGAGNNRMDLLKGIMDRGVGLYLTIAHRDVAQYSHHDFVNGVPGAMARLEAWVEFCSHARAYAAARGLPFYTGWESEFEVKVNHGEITGVSTAVFAQSHDIFSQAVKDHDPLLRNVYQVGHFDATAIWEVITAKNVGFDVLGLDPYRGSGSGQTTCQQTVVSKNLTPGNFRASPHWDRLGQPAVGLAETGTDVPAYTDTNVAAWINSIPAAMDTLDLEFVIWFNRNSGPNNDSDVITGNHPLSVAALAALIDKAPHE